MSANILIVEDNEDSCFAFANALQKKGYGVITAFSGEEALAILKKELVDLILLDIGLPQMDGIEVLKEIKDTDPDLLVIMITVLTDVQPAIEAMKLGAFDYLTKPFELEELKLVVEKALETQKLKREVARLKKQQREQFPDNEIFGNSPKIQEIKRLIEIVSDTPKTSVLIQGESGTGKELVANAIHNLSARRDNPLIKINCSTIPENLLESELFGHERGAFTDAKSMKKGIFELANGGTIFLDEISSMKLSLQPKLLRILESETFKRVGGTSDIKIDVRIIAATNADLEQCVKEGSFREDLYYRLKVMVIELPPLRVRRDDIIPLAMLFIDQNNREFNRKITSISPQAEELLLRYPWPGNVRELKNVIERAVILCRGDSILPEHLPRELQTEALPGQGLPAQGVQRPKVTGDFLPSAQLSLAEIEKAHIMNVLSQNKGNKSKTARILRISRSTLREKLKSYGITDT